LDYVSYDSSLNKVLSPVLFYVRRFYPTICYTYGPPNTRHHAISINGSLGLQINKG
jgi:hypothetical protein